MYILATLAKMINLINNKQQGGYNMARIQINDLQVAEKELSEQEMGDVTGGWLKWRAAGRQVRYKYRYKRRRVRVRQVRTRYRATGQKYGRWH
jgi:hypothetical protein